MALRFAFSLLFTVCAFGLGIAKPATPQCGPNAEFDDCGSVCAPTCARPKVTQICPELCITGCFCKEGFLKNFDGECVRRQECGVPHPPIQKPTLAAAESIFEPMPGPIIEPIPMSMDEVRKPIIEPIPMSNERRKRQLVIPSPLCPQHEVLNMCGPVKQPTCENPEPSMHAEECVIGCFCEKGYLRNKQDICVPATKCAAAAESIFQPMPGPIIEPVPMSMEEVRKPIIEPIPIIRMKRQLVIPNPLCPEHEVLNMCGPVKQPTCENPEPSMHAEECVIGCFCEKGYLRNKQDLCVPATKCAAQDNEMKPMPPAMCGDNEEWRQCKSCDATCDTPNPKCPRICLPGCQCKTGHVRVTKNRCELPQKVCVRFQPLPMPVPDEEVIQPLPMPVPNGDSIHILPFPVPKEDVIQPLPMPVPKDGMIHILPMPASDGDVFHPLPMPVPNGDKIHILPMPQPDEDVIQPLPMPVDEKVPTPQCKENEAYSKCGPIKQATCENPRSTLVHIEECVVGCFCKEGYLRNKQGICVPAAECMAPDHKCISDRETFYDSDTASQLDCMNSCYGITHPFLVLGFPQLSEKCQQVPRKPACVCNAPYVRSRMGLCVEKTECYF
jgi:hypothetical protein